MNKSEALLKTLEIYIETEKPVSQHFYQGLCLKALEQIKELEKEIKRHKKARKEIARSLQRVLSPALQPIG